jgi:hypothetical protein
MGSEIKMKLKIEFVFPVQQNMVRRFSTIIASKRKVRGVDTTGKRWSFYVKGNKADIFCDSCVKTQCERIHTSDLIEIPNDKIRVLMKYENFFLLTRSCRIEDITKLNGEKNETV